MQFLHTLEQFIMTYNYPDLNSLAPEPPRWLQKWGWIHFTSLKIEEKTFWGIFFFVCQRPEFFVLM
jgi:hypothetical protein